MTKIHGESPYGPFSFSHTIGGAVVHKSPEGYTLESRFLPSENVPEAGKPDPRKALCGGNFMPNTTMTRDDVVKQFGQDVWVNTYTHYMNPNDPGMSGRTVAPVKRPLPPLSPPGTFDMNRLRTRAKTEEQSPV